MMKQIIYFFISLCFLGNVVYAQSIHEKEVFVNNEKSMSLADFKGKKLLFITISPELADSVVRDVSLFEKRSLGNVHIFFLVSINSKSPSKLSSVDLRQSLQKRSIGASVLLVDGKQGSEKNKDVLLWLTNSRQNGHFNVKLVSMCQKFFVDENGQLYAVIGPEYNLDSKVVSKIVAKKKYE